MLSSTIKDFLKEVKKRREERNLKIIEKLNSKNIKISLEELMRFSKEKQIGIDVIGRPVIASLMIEKGYVANIKTAFEKYLKEGAS